MLVNKYRIFRLGFLILQQKSFFDKKNIFFFNYYFLTKNIFEKFLLIFKKTQFNSDSLLDATKLFLSLNLIFL